MTDIDIAALTIELINTLTPHTATTERTRNTNLPLIVIEEAGGPPASSSTPNRLIRQDVDVFVWAADKATARDIAGDIRTAIVTAPRLNPVRPLGTLTGARCTGPLWLPDTDWRPENAEWTPRYQLTASLTAHP